MNTSSSVVPHQESERDCDLESQFKTLCQTIAFSEGKFSLILARCNDPRLRTEIVKRLQNESIVPVQTRFVPKMTQILYTHLATSLSFQTPHALTILGLESARHLDNILISANMVRDEFRQRFSCPFILWVTDEVLGKLSQLAPDFNSWATLPIDFTGCRFAQPSLA